MSQDKNQPQPENGNGNDLKKIEQQLVKANPTIFKGIPEQKKTEILRMFSMSLSVEQIIERKITAHQGPLPQWEDLKKFQRTDWLDKATHICAQTLLNRFVKLCCLQTLPKPRHTIKTSVDRRANA